MAAAPLRVWRERDGRLLRLRLARPKANLIDAEMIAALDAALTDADRPSTPLRSAQGERGDVGVPGPSTPLRSAQGERGDMGVPAIRGVLLDAEGPHFSFGASVPEHLPANVAAMLKGLHALVLKMLEYPAPILVALRGQCIGGGLEVAATGHLLFAAPDAKLGQPEIVLGVFAPAASCLLPERIGRAAAEDLLLSGRSIDAAEAHRLGLVNAVAPDPEAAALAWFDASVAKHSAASLRFATGAARLDMVARVRSKLAAVEDLYLTGLMRTADAVEGLNAFIEKRPARWEDR